MTDFPTLAQLLTIFLTAFVPLIFQQTYKLNQRLSCLEGKINVIMLMCQTGGFESGGKDSHTTTGQNSEN